MFGRDPITPVVKLLKPRPRYYGEKGAQLKMDTLRRLYTVAAENIHKARERMPKHEEKKLHSFKVNDLVLVKDPCSAVFEPRYQPNYRVTAIFGDNRIEVQDEKGHKLVRRSSHVKYVEPSEKIVQQLPSKELLQKYGRSSKLLLPMKDIPDLQFTARKLETISEFQEHSESSWDDMEEVVEIVETSVSHQEFSNGPSTLLHDIDFHEHSQNSLKGAVGVALER